MCFHRPIRLEFDDDCYDIAGPASYLAIHIILVRSPRCIPYPSLFDITVSEAGDIRPASRSVLAMRNQRHLDEGLAFSGLHNLNEPSPFNSSYHPLETSRI
jgi:hypothetical protein